MPKIPAVRDPERQGGRLRETFRAAQVLVDASRRPGAVSADDDIGVAISVHVERRGRAADRRRAASADCEFPGGRGHRSRRAVTAPVSAPEVDPERRARRGSAVCALCIERDHAARASAIAADLDGSAIVIGRQLPAHRQRSRRDRGPRERRHEPRWHDGRVHARLGLSRNRIADGIGHGDIDVSRFGEAGRSFEARFTGCGCVRRSEDRWFVVEPRVGRVGRVRGPRAVSRSRDVRAFVAGDIRRGVVDRIRLVGRVLSSRANGVVDVRARSAGYRGGKEKSRPGEGHSKNLHLESQWMRLS